MTTATAAPSASSDWWADTAVRLGWRRFQRCPVGHHWSIVTPVRESELSEEQKRNARESKDVRIP
jgi:hypothetical protein